MKITYLAHSSFFIETERQMFLLDYGALPQRPQHGKLEQGVFDPDRYLVRKQSVEKNLIGYASHRHTDHFDADLAKAFLYHDRPFILSDEKNLKVPPYMGDQNFHRIFPQTLQTIEKIKIANTGSTDQGGSILFELPDLEFSIYYGADLAVWDDYPEFYQGFAKELTWLKQQRELFKATKVVFLPSGTSDGYQEEPLLNGAKQMIEMLQPKIIIPMHGYGYPDYYQNFGEIMQHKIGGTSLKLLTFKEYQKEDQEYRQCIIYPENSGDQIIID